MKGWIFTIVFFFSCLSLYTQDNTFRFDRLTIREGLSQSTVNCILQDRDGFMWFGTQDGLNRYDGYNFTIFKHDPVDTASLSDNFIHTIYQDAKGIIWIGTDGGLNRFDPVTQKFSYYQHEAGVEGSLPDNSVWAISGDGKENLWIGTSSGGLARFNKKTQLFTAFVHDPADRYSISSNSIKSILRDSDNNLWIGTVGGGVNRYDKDRGVFLHFKNNVFDTTTISGNFIHDLFEDNSGNIWVGTNKGASIIQSEEKQKTAIPFIRIAKKQQDQGGLSNNVVRCFYQDDGGAIWIGTDGGGINKLVNSRNLNNPSFRHYKHDPQLKTTISSNIIYDIYKDRSGSFWIGTYHGISKFDRKKQSFAHYQKVPDNKNSLNDNMVWSFVEDDKNILWIGTREGLSRVDRNNGNFTAYTDISPSAHFLNNKSVLSLIQHSSGQLFLGTVVGLYKAVLTKDHQINRFIQIECNKEFQLKDVENKVYVLYEDSDSYLWVGTRNGLSRIDVKTGDYRLFTKENGLSNNTIRAIFQGSEGTLWVGTESGLNRLSFDNKDSVQIKQYRQKSGNLSTLSNDMVVSIREDDQGILWLGTYGGGLNRFDPRKETFQRYTEKDGLSNNVIYGILADEKENLWMSTNKGLSRFNPLTGEFKTFEENDGLQSNEFNIGAYYKTRSGEFLFGGINGFNIFKPEEVKINEIPPQVIITDFQLFNKPVVIGKNSVLQKSISSTKEITLSYQQDNFSFEFAALHYSFPEKNQYAFKMVGFDQDWNYVGNRRVAPYTNLDPGEYTFLVKGSNSDGIWSEKVASVKITITPPFWETLWFRFLMAAGFFGAVSGIYWQRVRNIRAQRDYLEQQVQERTTEVVKQKEKIEAQKEAIEQEKEKSEKLLLNILPQETVDELKNKGKASARSYRNVTVMFTDFRNFTQIAEKLRPQELIAELDSHFIKFDEIIEKYDIEKIKTIGDSFMCAGGIPIRNKSNPIDVVLAGLEIQGYMETLKRLKTEQGKPYWDLRIGINSGELIAGVVGIKRFAYDVWGDTVNVASRMEMSGEVGKVNISGKTHALIKDFFDCTYRGKVLAKNKGEVDMYFVNGIKKELSVDGKGKIPNDMFWEYVNLKIYSSINYRKAERYIVKRLKKELPAELHYHDIKHTKDVCNAVERIAQAEGIKGEDLFLLKTAALYHDAGFVKKYKENEEIGVQMAEEALPRFGYSEKQIQQVASLILATKVPQQPENHLQEILCDADLDYLGRDDFFKIAEELKKEFMSYGIVDGDKSWDELQIKFLTSHRYFTNTSRETRRPKKMEHLEAIKKRYEEGKYQS